MLRYLLLCGTILSTVISTRAVTFDLDYASFADLSGDTTRSYVEIYTRIDRWSLDTKTVLSARRFGLIQNAPDTVKIGFTADVVVTNVSGDTVAHERHIVDQPVDESYSGTAYDDLFTAWGFFLRPGGYLLGVEIADHHSDRSARREMPIHVRTYSTANPILSDIELALSVAPVDVESRFAKHGLSVLANARRVFGYGAPVLYYYTELYHLEPGVEYALRATLINESGESVRQFGPFAVMSNDSTSVQVKGVNVMGYPDGEYTIRLTLGRGNDSTIVAERDAPFAVSRTPVATAITAERFKADVGWIASRAEMQAFDRATALEKARLIEEFWQSRDPSPETLVNEFKIEHYRRLAFADDAFTDVGRPGRDSDMGRVYVVYGPPSDIERHGAEANAKEYQIWHYERLESAPIFVFVDMVGTGIMTLVHSTARDEAQNPTWQTLVQPYEGTLQRQEQRMIGREWDTRELE